MKWEYIMFHHSASPLISGGLPVDAKIINKWHKERGFSEIGYHFVILPNGEIQEGRSLTKRGAHCDTNQMNYKAIGICLIGDFTKHKPTVQQYNSSVQLSRRLMENYDITVNNITQHNEYKVTQCPGKHFMIEQILHDLQDRDYTYDSELIEAVEGLAKLSIMYGYTADSQGIPLEFRPNETVTNERLAKILWRLVNNGGV